jgi:GntR family transcriptional regulator/MocR family aminotransferase
MQHNEASAPFSTKSIAFREHGPPRYEQLASILEGAIRDGRLRGGERLPPVRLLAQELAISVTTVTAALNLLSERHLIRAEVGRGTFVNSPAAGALAGQPSVPPASTEPSGDRRSPAPWRRRALMTIGARLRTRYPDALDCSTGRPDVELLPLAVLRRAWSATMATAAPGDLQYAGPEVIKALSDPLLRLLRQGGLQLAAEDLLIGSSAQQWMMLSLQVAALRSQVERPLVAVEEPGYPTIMDAFERAGARLIAVAVDGDGAVPDSLDRACRAGASMALLTPRAHNPTGCSWTSQRRASLADVLADHPHTIVVEDDQFADGSTTQPGSMLDDRRVRDRVVYIRSFSKLIAPDLRVAAAAAAPRLRARLAEAKSLEDGWTSRLLQKTLGLALDDGELHDVFVRARETYGGRRARAAEALNGVLQPHGGWTWCGADGLNLWVQLPPGIDATDVVERAAAAGVRVAPGEPFYLHPGRTHVVRLNAGSAPDHKAAFAGRVVGEAALASSSEGQSLIHV